MRTYFSRMLAMLFSASLVLGMGHEVLANPYPDPNAVPQDSAYPSSSFPDIHVRPASPDGRELLGIEVLRVRLDWDAATESYRLGNAVREMSGTPALVRRSRKPDRLGSYHGTLRDLATGEAIAHDSIGTGALYRRLTRSISFRFPIPTGPVTLELRAENPRTGEMEKVLETVLDPTAFEAAKIVDTAEVRLIKPATAGGDSLRINLYAEGFTEARRVEFWAAAERAASALANSRFPGFEHFEIHGVFAPSALKLGASANLGLPVPERDSFLGLFYPYWERFGRWYHVIYPTREERFRAAVASAPHDYVIALVDESSYWGIGNYRQYTAVPSHSSRFTYLLVHELGHFFGLNEEYEGGGRTELEFAPGMREPWSQNITFLREPSLRSLKWNRWVAESTPLPTPGNEWSTGKYGAYMGGYADSPANGAHSHKPGFGCVMNSGTDFCPVCKAAIEAVVAHDLGR